MMQRKYTVTDKEIQFLADLRRNGFLVRKLMDGEEIRLAEALTKRGLVLKGTTDELPSTRQYLLTPDGAEVVDILV